MGMRTVVAGAILVAAGVSTGAQAQSLDPYALLYGGFVKHGVMHVEGGGIPAPGTDMPVDHGWGVGAAAGVRVFDNLLTDVDVFLAKHRDYGPGLGDLETLSVMLNAKGAFALNDMFEVYGGVGVGGLYAYFDDNVAANCGWGPAYQLMIGVTAQVTENISLFGELRHQNTFGPIHTAPSGLDVNIGGVNAALVGIKLSM